MQVLANEETEHFLSILREQGVESVFDALPDDVVKVAVLAYQRGFVAGWQKRRDVER